MKKKSAKVGESKAAYGAKKRAAPAAAPVQTESTDDAVFRRVADKIFSERKELLHKLAQ